MIYIITHHTSGTQYVGQTVNTIAKRWDRHCAAARKLKNCPYLSNAIIKYGRQAFDMEIVDWATSQAELNAKEIYWIAQLNTLAPNGYNLDAGGRGGPRHPDSMAKRSAKLRGRPSHNRGIKFSPERCKQMSEAAKARFAVPGYVNPYKGRKMTPEQREQLSHAKTGRPILAKRRHVQCVETGQCFEGVKVAGEWLNSVGKGKSGDSGIVRARDHADKTCGGYHWVTILDPRA